MNKPNDKVEVRHRISLTEIEVIEIMLLIRDGKLTNKKIAELYNVKPTVIGSIRRSRLWENVDEAMEMREAKKRVFIKLAKEMTTDIERVLSKKEISEQEKSVVHDIVLSGLLRDIR